MKKMMFVRDSPVVILTLMHKVSDCSQIQGLICSSANLMQKIWVFTDKEQEPLMLYVRIMRKWKEL